MGFLRHLELRHTGSPMRPQNSDSSAPSFIAIKFSLLNWGLRQNGPTVHFDSVYSCNQSNLPRLYHTVLVRERQSEFRKRPSGTDSAGLLVQIYEAKGGDGARNCFQSHATT
ncbi:hypothetical protein G7Y89_g11517 [Cudoniella acicularis]|uniref:Uncharacterized protein n=1 Tax=Cudoniella acicularis TaxID=354080 RepID=A0A8H4W0K4_9HELO|nr:hypothetical protein G7Y89_g11517 [Cudoniella acicularis]